MSSGVTAILQAYARPHTLRQQYKAIMSQTVKPDEVWLIQNCYDPSPWIDLQLANNCVSIISNHNFGVWYRFAAALMAKTKYVCIFDDDTIPGPKWFENCIQCNEKQKGLYGTIGVLFGSEKGYGADDSVYGTGDQRVGWDVPNEKTMKVDIVGHSWFFEKDLLHYFWREAPDLQEFKCAGEDIHFSHMLQKHAGLGTYVPPHPFNDRDLWGSLPDTAASYGGDSVATANFAIPNMTNYLRHCVEDGFEIVNKDTYREGKSLSKKERWD